MRLRTKSGPKEVDPYAVERIVPMPPHPRAVLAVRLVDPDDPIPLPDDVIRTYVTTAKMASERPVRAAALLVAQEPPPVFPGFLAGLEARVAELEARLAQLDDDAGAVLELHGQALAEMALVVPALHWWAELAEPGRGAWPTAQLCQEYADSGERGRPGVP